MKMLHIQRFIHIVVVVAFIAMTAPFALPAQAASVTSFSDNLSRLSVSTLANHTIQFVTPTGISGGQDFTLTFDADFTMGSFAVNNIDMATATTCGGSFSDVTLAASPSGATWGVAQSGQIITFTSAAGTVTATHCVQIEIGANATSGGAGTIQITNPSGAQTASLVLGGSMADSGTLGIAIVASGGDQVNITATVDPTISFATTDSSIGYGTLTSSGARWANGAATGSGTEVTAHDLTAATNAASGYTIYVLGATLTSGLNTINAIGGSATASTIGSEQFGLKVSAAGGSGAAVAPYASADYAYNATTTQDDIATSSVPSTTTTYSITYIGNISATTEPGSYATTLTYTATGLF
jgi:hypothetical protein